MEFLASNWLIANKNRHIFILFLFFLQVSAQQNPTVTEKPKTVDSLRIQSDSVQNHLPAKAKQGFFRHEGYPKPGRAARLSLLLPGLGQAYNQRYWKIPLVYAALGAVGYFAWTNHREYQQYRAAYLARTDNNPATVDTQFPTLSDENVRLTRDYFRRNRDFNLILLSIFYALNSIEAYVDAHLNGFSVSDNLSLKVLPATEYPNPFYQAGIKFSLQFR